MYCLILLVTWEPSNKCSSKSKTSCSDGISLVIVALVSSSSTIAKLSSRGLCNNKSQYSPIHQTVANCKPSWASIISSFLFNILYNLLVAYCCNSDEVFETNLIKLLITSCSTKLKAFLFFQLI